MPPLTEPEMRKSVEHMIALVTRYLLEDVTDYDSRVRYGEMLLAAAREVLPEDSWRRDEPLGPPRR